MQFRGARIVGVGGAQPSAVVSGSALTRPFGKSAEWLLQRTGIAQVRRMGAGEDLVELGVTAARAALEDARTDAGDVDAIIVATCSGSPVGSPALSERLAGRLNSSAVAFDVNAACAGFCYALGTAGDLIGAGDVRRVLVIGAEQMSAMLDPADLGTSILFGDGAGAVVVEACAADDTGIGPAAWSSQGEEADALVVPPGETTMRMHGQRVFRWAVNEVHKVAATAMLRAGVSAREIEIFVPHQANLRIIEAIRRKLGLDHADTATDIVDSGNTSAASIPLALARMRHSGRTRTGQLALLSGYGAGLSIAAQVVRLP